MFLCRITTFIHFIQYLLLYFNFEYFLGPTFTFFYRLSVFNVYSSPLFIPSFLFLILLNSFVSLFVNFHGILSQREKMRLPLTNFSSSYILFFSSFLGFVLLQIPKPEITPFEFTIQNIAV